eukprot:TRINITY_DN7_c11_g1_i1.p1 TRINITY_DN7_c11_g1~~TRINITY_DN7_c11_g1_i1.p1  ORF type:complete len:461 (+),score=63.98 TRINITY_DN7_c11_g1_i1:86-1468(+)
MSATVPVLDAALFKQRYKAFLDGWMLLNRKAKTPADAIAISAGTYRATDPAFSVTQAFLLWLFGFEFTKILVVVMESGLTIVCSKKLAHLFRSLDEATAVNITLYDSAPASDSVASVLAAVGGSFKGKTVFALPDEPQAGDLATTWERALSSSRFGVSQALPLLSFVMVKMDDAQQKLVKNAATIASTLTAKVMTPTLKLFLKDTTTVYTHKMLIDKLAGFLLEPSRISKRLDPKVVDMTHLPVIQSGPQQALFSPPTSPSASLSGSAPSVEPLSFQCVTTLIGVRFKGYCAEVGRTYFSAPSSQQRQNYELLLKIRTKVLSALTPKTKLASVYSTAAEMVKDPALLSCFTSCLGTPMSTYLRDDRFSLRSGSTRTLSTPSTYCLTFGFENIPGDGGYSLSIVDTVLIEGESGDETAKVTVLTAKAPVDFQSLQLSDELKRPREEQEPGEPASKKAKISE